MDKIKGHELIKLFDNFHELIKYNSVVTNLWIEWLQNNITEKEMMFRIVILLHKENVSLKNKLIESTHNTNE